MMCLGLSSNTAGKEEDIPSTRRRIQIHKETISSPSDQHFEGNEEVGREGERPTLTGCRASLRAAGVEQPRMRRNRPITCGGEYPEARGARGDRESGQF